MTKGRSLSASTALSAVAEKLLRDGRHRCAGADVVVPPTAAGDAARGARELTPTAR